MIKTLIERLTARRNKADSVSPDAELVIDALRRLTGDEDFQLFRAVLQSRFAMLARTVTTADRNMVDHIRGEMFMLEQLYNMTSAEGVETLAASSKEKKELEQILYGQLAEDNIL